MTGCVGIQLSVSAGVSAQTTVRSGESRLIWSAMYVSLYRPIADTTMANGLPMAVLRVQKIAGWVTTCRAPAEAIEPGNERRELLRPEQTVDPRFLRLRCPRCESANPTGPSRRARGQPDFQLLLFPMAALIDAP